MEYEHRCWDGRHSVWVATSKGRYCPTRQKRWSPTPTLTIPVPSVCVKASVVVGRRRGVGVKRVRGTVGVVEVEVEMGRVEVEVKGSVKNGKWSASGRRKLGMVGVNDSLHCWVDCWLSSVDGLFVPFFLAPDSNR